jgi:hypothetical protein
MDYFWKENKRFTLFVGGGLLFVLFFHWFVLGPIRAGATKAERDRVNERKDLESRMAQGVPAPDALAAAKRDRDQYQKSLAAVSKELVFKPDDRYKRGERESAKAHYDNLRLEIEKGLKDKAKDAKVEFNGAVGLGEESSPDQIPELLLRMAAAERLVAVALAAGIEKIEQVDAMATPSRDAAPGPGAFLNAYGIFFKFRAKAETAYRIAHAVQKKGQYLAVTQLDWSRDDVARDSVLVQMGVAVLSVDEKAPLVPKPAGGAP